MKVTCALIIENNKILAVKRGHDQYNPGMWEFPGGKVKEGESLENCIKRELYEELDIEVTLHKLLPPVVHNYPEFEIKLIPFICEMKNGDLKLAEHAEFKWCELGDLGQLDFTEADRKIIEKMKKAGGLPALGNSDRK
jgi:8-oxo-dGTP diphosphatase